MKRLQSSFLLLGLLCFVGCGHLSPTGVYQGDTVLYKSDLSVKTCYDVIHTFVAWELANRPLLTKYPEITQSANVMRNGAPQWFATAYRMRDAYKANPTDANRTALQTAMSVIQQALAEAQGYMAEAALK